MKLFSEKTSKIVETLKAYGKILKEQSSLVGQHVRGGLSSSNFDRIYPRIPFATRIEYYLTVGRVQNVVESYVLNITNREWYYDDTSEGAYESSIKLMEDWEERHNVTNVITEMVRNWIINGVHIISPEDWKPIQLQSIQAKRRDDFGHTLEYIQIINGQEHVIEAKDFLEIPYIHLDREPWPTGMFDSLMNRDYIDVDGKDPRATLQLYRQALQDNGAIHHKYAAPRVVYQFPGVNQETIDNDIIPTLEGMRPGDRAAFNTEVDIKQETVDGQSRFIEHLNKIIDEVDIGLQSSSNRIISEPSAMADAREAGFQDDDRTLGIMEKIRQFMNMFVIPRITGLEPGMVEFKWGAKDQFDLEFPPAIKDALGGHVISPEQAAIILEENFHWKIPTPDDVKAKFGDVIQEPTEPDKKDPDISPEMVKLLLLHDEIKIAKEANR